MYSDATKVAAKRSGDEHDPDTSVPESVKDYFARLSEDHNSSNSKRYNSASCNSCSSNGNSKRTIGRFSTACRLLDAVAIQLFKFFIACNARCSENYMSKYPCKDISNAVKIFEKKLCCLCNHKAVSFTTRSGDRYLICFKPKVKDGKLHHKGKCCCKVRKIG